MMRRGAKPPCRVGAVACVAAALVLPVVVPAAEAGDPFAPLAIYDGDWTVHAEHPWGGATAGTANRLASRCRRFTAYFACEQTIDGQTASLIVYTIADAAAGRFNTRTISPDGRAAARGDLVLAGAHWTYLDKPAPPLSGNWSRVENRIVDRDHIRFEEYESSDQSVTWRMTNAGDEVRTRP